MAKTIAGRTVVDSAVADYVRSVLGDVSLKRWSIEAGEPDKTLHKLHIRITMPHSATLSVIERLLPHVQGFTAEMGRHDGESGVEISAAMLFSLVDLVKLAAEKIESDNRG